MEIVNCSICCGSGKITCPTCGGNGDIFISFDIGRKQCSRCYGKGIIICNNCDGKKYIQLG